MQVTVWKRPLLLGPEVLEPTPRTKALRDVQRPKKTAADLDEGMAARMIQGMHHARKARNFIKLLVRAMYTKIDDGQGNVYYLNERTGETTWEKPRLLGSSELEKTPRKQRPGAQRPIKRAEDMTEAEAVAKIENWMRVRRNRAKLRLYARAIWRKMIDPDSGDAYYYNTQSKVCCSHCVSVSNKRARESKRARVVTHLPLRHRSLCGSGRFCLAPSRWRSHPALVRCGLCSGPSVPLPT